MAVGYEAEPLLLGRVVVAAAEALAAAARMRPSEYFMMSKG
jgi:hypothetical protein